MPTHPCGYRAFTLSELQAATNGFSPTSLLAGGAGPRPSLEPGSGAAAAGAEAAAQPQQAGVSSTAAAADGGGGTRHMTAPAAVGAVAAGAYGGVLADGTGVTVTKAATAQEVWPWPWPWPWSSVRA